MVPPTVQIGWETDQTYSTESSIDYYQIRFKPYIQTQFSATNVLNVDRLFYNELTFELDKFMSNLFGEFKIYYDGHACFNFGYEVQDILFTIETAIKFNQCYKILIQSLKDWSNWRGIG